MLKDVLTVAKKELKNCFSDKAILAQILLLPFIMVFGYAMLMSVVGGGTNGTDEKDYTAYCINAPEYMTVGFEELGIKSAELDVDTIKNQIAEKECDLLVVFPEDFAIAEVGRWSFLMFRYGTIPKAPIPLSFIAQLHNFSVHSSPVYLQ